MPSGKMITSRGFRHPSADPVHDQTRAKWLEIVTGTVIHLRIGGFIPLLSWFEARSGDSPAALYELLSNWAADINGVGRSHFGHLIRLQGASATLFFSDTERTADSLERALFAAVTLRNRFLSVNRSAQIPEQVRLYPAIAVAHGTLQSFRVQGSGPNIPLFFGPPLDEAIQVSGNAIQEILLCASVSMRMPTDLAHTRPSVPTTVVVRLMDLQRPDLPEKPSVSSPAHLESLLLPVRGTPISTPPVSPDVCKTTVAVIRTSGLLAGPPNSSTAFEDWYGSIADLARRFSARIGRIDPGKITLTELIFDTSQRKMQDESVALRCAMSLQQSARTSITISDQRLGIASGKLFVLPSRVLSEPAEYLSGAFHTSHRLSTWARPWEVLVSRSTISRCGFGYDWGPPPRTSDQTDTELHGARVLNGEGAFGTRLKSRSRGDLVGRQAFFVALRSYAQRAFAGHGQVVMLYGRAGMGKSALLVHLGQQLRTTFRVPVFVGESDAFQRHTPYNAWMPVLRAWFGLSSIQDVDRAKNLLVRKISPLGEDLLERLPLLRLVTGIPLPDSDVTRDLSPTSQREALNSLMFDLLSRAHRNSPIAFLFEDTHWMDDASLELARYLVRNLQNHPIFFAFSRRPEEPNQSPVHALLEAVRGCERLEIGALPPDAQITLACRHIGATRLSPELESILLATAKGHALMLEEFALLLRDTNRVRIEPDGIAHLLPATDSPLPTTLDEMILARVSCLDEGTRLTLMTASAIGRTFSLSVLEQVYPVPFDRHVLLSRLERVDGLDIVRRGSEEDERTVRRATHYSPDSVHLADDTFFFKHSMIQHAIYQSLTASVRRNLHEAIAGALERRMAGGSRTELVPLIAEHYRHTQRLDKQRIFFREAGEIARARALNREALNFFQAAEALYHGSPDAVTHADILEAEVGVLNLLGDRERQRELIQRWKDIATQLGDSHRQSEALRAEATLLARLGQLNASAVLLEQALHLAEDRHDRLQEARVWRVISSIKHQQEDQEGALTSAQTALDCAIQAESWTDVSVIEANVGVILGTLGRIAEGRAKLESALERAEKRRDSRWTGIFLAELGVLEIREGHFDRAIEVLEQALVRKQSVGERHEEAITLSNLGLAQLSVGQFELAAGYLARALEISRQVEGRLIEVHILENQGVLAQYQGHLEQAHSLFSEALRLARHPSVQANQTTLFERLIRIEIERHQWDSARSYLSSAERLNLLTLPLFQALEFRFAASVHPKEHAVALFNDLASSMKSVALCSLLGYSGLYDIAVALQHIGMPEAERWLDMSRQELQLRASRIQNVSLRHGMLQHVPLHRLILG